MMIVTEGIRAPHPAFQDSQLSRWFALQPAVVDLWQVRRVVRSPLGCCPLLTEGARYHEGACIETEELRDFRQTPAAIPDQRKVMGTVAIYSQERSRDFLTPSEVSPLLAAKQKVRFGIRDHAMILLVCWHDLRVAELMEIPRADLDSARILVGRLKNGLSTSQPLQGDELRALRAYLRTRKDNLPWLFLSSQQTQFVRQAFNYLLAQAGKRAGLGHIHPHMLRHSCGHGLAERGVDTRLMQDWLGHRDIRHTAHYSRTSAKRFEGVWK
jgi:type 1 fimbriae regulatory protein FimB